MLSLQIYCQNEKVLSLNFDKKVVRIGRDPSCDVTLPDPTLSRTHCILSQKENLWLLEDSSKNGIIIEPDERVVQRVRIEGTKRFRIGRFFSIEVFPKDPSKAKDEKTLVTSPRPTQVVVIDPTNEKLILGRALIKGRDLEGNTLERLIEPSLTLGSHEGNDLVLSSDAVSQFHARIDLRQNEYILSDLHSTNGTYVDGVRVMRATLKTGATVQMGPFDFSFKIEQNEISITPKATHQYLGMVSEHKSMKRIFAMVDALGSTDAAVFILGETGTGKELLARAIHIASRRYGNPFVALNCAALPKDLVETELFGHEKGAFTGATQNRIGAFEAAHQGTLFLDEIAELDLNLQAKILRALESGEVKRVGASEPIKTSVRIVSATHKNLIEEVKAGRFREDLYYRLHVVPLHLPPLRERIDDLELLVPHLLKELHLDFEVDPGLMQSLRTYSFPGNIRELKNILQRAAIEFEVIAQTSEKKIARILKLKHFSFLDNIQAIRLPQTPEEIAEKNSLELMLQEKDYNQSEVARALGIPISTLHDRVKKYGLVTRRPRVQN